jgi:aspartate-semialdehyde dehydrogenase
MNTQVFKEKWPISILFTATRFHAILFEDNGYTKEEMKLVRNQKILGDNTIAVTATAVRVPVVGGHSEAVNVEFTNDFDVNDVRNILHHTDGVVVQDNTDTYTYPMPLYAEGRMPFCR